MVGLTQSNSGSSLSEQKTQIPKRKARNWKSEAEADSGISSKQR